MTAFDDLPTLTNRPRQAVPKGLPRALTKPQERKVKESHAKAFREAVWARDQRRSRATGRPLSKSGTDYQIVGEVHHVIPRSLAPDRVYDVGNGLLLSKLEHLQAETICPNAPEHRLLEIDGPEDRGQLQAFVWRDVDGEEVKRRIG